MSLKEVFALMTSYGLSIPLWSYLYHNTHAKTVTPQGIVFVVMIAVLSVAVFVCLLRFMTDKRFGRQELFQTLAWITASPASLVGLLLYCLATGDRFYLKD